jgi:hypothetical protein
MRRQTLLVGIMNQSGAKEADFAIVCIAFWDVLGSCGFETLGHG